MYHIFFIHSSVDGHLGWFRVLAIVNSATVNIVVRVYFFRLWFSLDICSGVGLLDHMVVLFLHWFSYVEPLLRFWDRSCWVMIHNPFNMLLGSVWYYSWSSFVGSMFANCPTCWNLFVTPKWTWWCFHGYSWTCWEWCHLTRPFPAEVDPGDTAFLFQHSRRDDQGWKRQGPAQHCAGSSDSRASLHLSSDTCWWGSFRQVPNTSGPHFLFYKENKIYQDRLF